MRRYCTHKNCFNWYSNDALLYGTSKNCFNWYSNEALLCLQELLNLVPQWGVIVLTRTALTGAPMRRYCTYKNCFNWYPNETLLYGTHKNCFNWHSNEELLYSQELLYLVLHCGVIVLTRIALTGTPMRRYCTHKNCFTGTPMRRYCIHKNCFNWYSNEALLYSQELLQQVP
jgi:hypothetical protein